MRIIFAFIVGLAAVALLCLWLCSAALGMASWFAAEPRKTVLADTAFFLFLYSTIPLLTIGLLGGML
jgi:hypothetical protein